MMICEVLGPVAPDTQIEPLTFYAYRVPAGFPSPADDYVETSLDPTTLLVRRPAATFFVRASGPSMEGVGIYDGDILVVDRSVQPQAGDIVVAIIDGGLTVKELVKMVDGWALAPAHADFPTMPIDAELGLHVWGVVMWSLTALCRR